MACSSFRRCKRRRLGGRRNPSPSPPESRNWASLPSDVLWEMFRRLRAADILCGASQVCAAWRRFSIEERALWRRIDLTADAGDAWNWSKRRRAAMGRVALERSAGRFLCHVAASAPSLRSLRVRPFRHLNIYRHSAHLISRVVVKLPLLEELVLSNLILPDDMLAALLEHCPRLERLDLGGCVTSSKTARRRGKRTIKHLTLPRYVPYVERPESIR